MSISTPKSKKANKFTLFCIVAVMAMIAFLAVFWTLKLTEEPAVSAISRDGVVTEIQKMARLNTVAFGVDTVITAQKEGNWYKLWQDEQKGLFVARGRVLAGVDLGKITADNVQVTFDPQTDPKVAPHANITVTLPPSQVFEVFLDDIQVYDWKTGLFGVVDNDPEILNQAQTSAKAEVLKKACQGDIMTLATDNATEQIKGLFALTGATVVVNGDVGACRI
ncbi:MULTISPECIES: DUF4230 domain-containing protein [Moraxella]|jgi:hypothetical protein|uniref:DUF4230 domain-containing protein n=2 Tax=Moraxella lacunata TaxID=477 RepID=A0A1B8Q5V1_MORLA|nr:MULTISPECIES: DUF4230 domain-containing protein [Moraxella]MBE9587012.1 DUF4230 domain-containing protein [Moraxella sp. K1630]MBE9589580.1 DUF4230 domain-containing protein [Moraxella sp. K127]MBE9595250.1 DUF4230 domain-containing protein [Moraxella sp. K2450]MDH9219502.1 DUF4230 domain-containing protein [Moraxella lacunata]MDI4482270.1 DUF4230 domain-containing protein [Moraxella lacunata]